MIMSYRNFEDVTIRGLDLSLAYFPADHWRLTGNYSFVNDNFFENLKFSHGEGRCRYSPQRTPAQGQTRE